MALDLVHFLAPETGPTIWNEKSCVSCLGVCCCEVSGGMCKRKCPLGNEACCPCTATIQLLKTFTSALSDPAYLGHMSGPVENQACMFR